MARSPAVACDVHAPGLPRDNASVEAEADGLKAALKAAGRGGARDAAGADALLARLQEVRRPRRAVDRCGTSLVAGLLTAVSNQRSFQA